MAPHANHPVQPLRGSANVGSPLFIRTLWVILCLFPLELLGQLTAPTATPDSNPAPQPCPCHCAGQFGGPPAPNLESYRDSNCPASMFNSCRCDPATNGPLCGYTSEGMNTYENYQNACIAWLNAQCPCPENTLPRNPDQCCPLPSECPGEDCGFTSLFDCGPLCAFFEQFFDSVCSMLQAEIAGGEERRCVTLNASAGSASSSATLCCPEGSHISGCEPWAGDGGELNGQCEVLYPNSGCLAVSYVCRCPGIKLQCTPDGSPTPTPIPSPTPTNTPPPESTSTPTPTPPDGATPTPAGKKVFIRS